MENLTSSSRKMTMSNWENLSFTMTILSKKYYQEGLNVIPEMVALWYMSLLSLFRKAKNGFFKKK